MQPKTNKPITWAKPVFSPSQISMAHKCFRSWLLRYVLGIKTFDKASRSKALGVLIHNCLAAYLRGGRVTDATLDDLTESDRKAVELYRSHVRDEKGDEAADKAVEKLLRDAPQRALAGLHFLPDATASLARWVETPLKLDTRPIHRFGAAIMFSDWSRLDLVVQRIDGVWFVYDHKSTSGYKQDPWAYVPTVDQLADDVQLLLYALCVMQATGSREIWCRWVYYYTGEALPAQAITRDVLVTWDDAIARVQKYFDLCDMMATEIRRTLRLDQLPAIEAHPFPSDVLETSRPCDAYRGCGYKHNQCKPPDVPLDRLVKRPTPNKQEEKSAMSPVEQRMQQMAAAGYIQTPSAAPPQQQVTNPVPQVAAPQIAIPTGYAPQLDSAGNLIGWIPLAPAPAPAASVSPTLPAGDPAAGLSLPGQVVAPVAAQTAAQAPAPSAIPLAAEAVAHVGPILDAPSGSTPKAKRGAKNADKIDAAGGLDGVDAALEALRDKAKKLGAVIEVKITLDGAGS